MARTDPYVFCELVLRDQKTGERIILAEHHKVWLEFVQYCRDIGKYCGIVAPYRSGKSFLITLGMILLEWGMYGVNRRIKLVSGSDQLVIEKTKELRQYIEPEGRFSRDYRFVFPDVKPATVTTEARRREGWTQHVFQLERTAPGGPSFWAHTVKGVAEGGGCDLVVFDDCVTRTNTLEKPADIPKTISAVQETFLKRLDPPGQFAIYLNTLWTANDCTSHLMKNKLARWCFLIQRISDDFECIEQEVIGDV